MRIAIVRQKYNPYGGAERFIERALVALRATGSVQLCVIGRAWTQKPGIDFIACDPPFRTSLGRDRSFAGAVIDLLATHRFDIVQSHERIPGLALYRAGDGVHASWLEQRARVLPGWKRLAVAANPYHRYVLAAEREMFKHPALRAVICNSLMVRDDIAQRFAPVPAALHVVHNGVDLEVYHPRAAARRDEMRAAIGVRDDTPMFLYAGSGFERKGVAQLLRALARVAAPACVVIAGADKHAPRYRRLAMRLGLEKRTHFIGPAGNLVDWYGAADAFVLPTLYDPMPNAALEALACGLPVITTLQCGARELIESGRNGVVLDALDIDGLAAALSDLARTGRAGAMRAAARASVEHLSLDAMADRLLALYRTLAPAG